MTLDEAIQHCEDVAASNTCADCASEHEQLAAWLKELKDYRANYERKAAELQGIDAQLLEQINIDELRRRYYNVWF